MIYPESTVTDSAKKRTYPDTKQSTPKKIQKVHSVNEPGEMFLTQEDQVTGSILDEETKTESRYHKPQPPKLTH